MIQSRSDNAANVERMVGGGDGASDLDPIEMAASGQDAGSVGAIAAVDAANSRIDALRTAVQGAGGAGKDAGKLRRRKTR